MYYTSKDNVDFYIKSNTDPYYKEGKLEENSKLGVLLNKIYNILFTNPGEVMGDLDFGVGLEYYLWSTNVSADYIYDIIIEQFNTYIPELQYEKYFLDVYIEKGEFKDILIIDFMIESITFKAIIK